MILADNNIGVDMMKMKGEIKMKKKCIKFICVLISLVIIFPAIVSAKEKGKSIGKPTQTEKKVEKSNINKKVNEERAVKGQEKKAEKLQQREMKKKERELKKANKLTGRENALTRGKGNKYGLKRVVSEDATANYEKGRKNAISKISDLIKELPSEAYDGLKNAIISIGKFIGVVPEEPVITDYQA